MYIFLPEEDSLPSSSSKVTPGERCNWETMTRSAPLIMKVPRSVIIGRSQKKTSCSRISLTFFVPVSGSSSRITRRRVTFIGTE